MEIGTLSDEEALALVALAGVKIWSVTRFYLSGIGEPIHPVEKFQRRRTGSASFDTPASAARAYLEWVEAGQPLSPAKQTRIT